MARSSPRSRRDGLTEQERAVLQAIANGVAQKDLSMYLGMGRQAPKKRIASAALLCNARNTTHLVAMLLRAGILR